MKTRRITVSVVWLGLMVSPAFGQFASMVGFQALIKDAEGNPIEVAVDLEFRIYDAATLGNLIDMDGDGAVEDLCGEDVTCVAAVTPTNGIVSTKFGPIHPSAFDGNPRWLEVRVNTEPLSRIEMATAPATSEQVNIPGSGTPAIEVDGSGNVTIPGTIQAGSSITIDGVNDKITASSGKINFDNEDLVTTGNVGIGTTEPVAQLDVVGEGTVGGTGVITSSGTTVTGIGTAFTTELHVGDFIIVGSQEKLVDEITSDTQLTTDSAFDPPANKSVYTFRQTIARFADSNGDEVLVINAVGNMGVGTTSPSEKLHVVGNANVDGTVYGDAFSSNSALQLQTGGTTRIYVDDTTGNVGIGTTDPGARKLRVNGDVQATAYYGDGSNLAGITSVPSGVIVMWAGTRAAIPPGWALCDGTNGTPDLQERFVFGILNIEDPGTTGGSSDHTHSTGNIPVQFIGTASANTLDVMTITAPRLTMDVGLGGTRVARYSSVGIAEDHTATQSRLSSLDVNVGKSSSLPLYYKLAFIMKL